MKIRPTLAVLTLFLVLGPGGHAQSTGKEEATAVARARTLVAHGEYAEAATVLQTFQTKNPTGDAALELGLLQQYLGQRPQARRTLQVLLLAEAPAATAHDYVRAARASRALASLIPPQAKQHIEAANDLFREATTIAPNDPAVHTAWGDLFFEKFDRREAARSYQLALKANPDYAPAVLGMARVIADENPPAAVKYARRALELNGGDAAVHVFLADRLVDDDKLEEARNQIAKALDINPNHLEALALRAAISYVQGKDAEYQTDVTAALEINPLYGEVYRQAGAVAARFYRFDEAVEQVRRALALDRDNIRAHADLGAHLMRTGDETGARRALEMAFRVDPYDIYTFNLLELLDELDKFQILREGDLVIKLHPDEFGVMKEYVVPLAQEALASLSERWQFTPKGPLLIEVFPEHDDFAVRTVGLPGMVGALGACFGRVVTMDSPRARPPGEFNWGATLWHELAHVITLQLSNQRIPRWLTEGISVFEEKRARPEWGREMELSFARAMDAGEVLEVRDLNAGFQRDPRTIALSYYEASLLVEHVVERFGEPKLRELVQSFSEGINTDAAVGKVLSVDVDDLQTSFDGFLDERFGKLRQALKAPDDFAPDAPVEALKAYASSHPESFPVQMALGRALRPTDPTEAIAAFERAASLVPMATGAESPYMQIVEVALANGDKATAADALERLTEQDHTDVNAARQLAGLTDPEKDSERHKVALQRLVAVDPFDAQAHSTLGRMTLAAGRAGEAIRMFRVALAAGPIDRASAHADLAEALFASGQRDDAKREALAALEIAPTFERAQDLLLKLSEGGR